MKVCIYGAGAIGGYVAVLMKLAGIDVSLVARGTQLAAIRDNGLRLLIGGEEKTAHMRATADPADLGPQDYVIVALKAHQAWEVAEQMQPLLGPHTAVVTAQNGLPWWYFYGFEGQYADCRIESVDPNGRQWAAIGPERVIGCTVYPAAEIEAPGVIRHVAGDKFGLGEPTRRQTERVRILSELFARAGLKAPVLPEIRNDIWLKLWGNLCFNPISALTHATLDVVATDPGTRELSRHMMEEAERIARRIGVPFPRRHRQEDQRGRAGGRSPHFHAAGRGQGPADRTRRAAHLRAGTRPARRSADAPHQRRARAGPADGARQGPLPDLSRRRRHRGLRIGQPSL